MIKFIITATALLLSVLSNLQDNGKAMQGEFNGKLSDIGRGLCITSPPDQNNRTNTMKNYSTYKQDFNKIMLELDTNTLNIQDQKKIFGKEYAKIAPNEILEFVQDKDFILGIDKGTDEDILVFSRQLGLIL
jgi:hypothetical protein